MLAIITIIHVFTCFFLILVVLLQAGKGGGLSGALGGPSESVFSNRGATTFLNKLTTICAIIFMITSLSQAILISKKTTVLKKEKIEEKVKKEIPKNTIPEQKKK